MIFQRTISRLGIVGTLGVLILFFCSWYLLLVRLIWLDDAKPLWWIYQIAHLALFIAATSYVLSDSKKHKSVVLLIVSILIGLIPYESWFSIFIGLKANIGNQLSGFTDGMPLLVRVVLEVGFFPVAHFILLITLQFIVRRHVLTKQ